jgi:hypothetical protein
MSLSHLSLVGGVSQQKSTSPSRPKKRGRCSHSRAVHLLQWHALSLTVPDAPTHSHVQCDALPLFARLLKAVPVGKLEVH